MSDIKKIGIDVDGVLRDFSGDLYEVVKRERPQWLKPGVDVITEWDMEKCFNATRDETALVVAHDAVNKTILCHLLGLTPSEIWMIKQGNGGITVINLADKEGDPDEIACLNITSHLGGIIDSTATGAL